MHAEQLLGTIQDVLASCEEPQQQRDPEVNERPTINAPQDHERKRSMTVF